MGELKPNGQRAKNAITLMWIMLILEIVSLISGYFQYNLLQIAKNGGEVTTEMINTNDVREQVIAILYLIWFIVSAVTFIQWFRRAYYNLHLKVNNLSYSEGWVAGSWFVPIISFFRPYQIMKELYEETQNLLKKNQLGFHHNLTTRAVGWWWGLWITSLFLGQIASQMSIKETVDVLINSTIVSLIRNILGIASALLVIKVIKDYSNVEPLLHEIKNEEEITNV
ncbi:MAG TPA: DUF4328 domain-containing protein [Crocinitomicaceae bacterium]|nr:DUF4328 domain-containing protein [Crocinitomicaceae bacterium]